MSTYDTCDEEVSRGGILQPCKKTAVALRMDPEYPQSYPVCAYHARGEMVPLVEIMRANRTFRATPVGGDPSFGQKITIRTDGSES